MGEREKGEKEERECVCENEKLLADMKKVDEEMG